MKWRNSYQHISYSETIVCLCCSTRINALEKMEYEHKEDRIRIVVTEEFPHRNLFRQTARAKYGGTS